MPPHPLTRFERARVAGARALQIALGAPPLIEPTTPIARLDPLRMALAEIEKGIVPLTVQRLSEPRVRNARH